MYEVDSQVQVGNGAMVCTELNDGLGGQVLEKSPENLRQDLSNIAAEVAETARRNEEVNAQFQIDNNQRQLKLEQELKDVSDEYQSVIEQLKDTESRVNKKEKQFWQQYEANRKNNGRFYEAKVKLIKAQNTRKLLTKLHNMDDETLKLQMEEIAQDITEQEQGITKFRGRIYELEQKIRCIDTEQKNILENMDAKKCQNQELEAWIEELEKEKSSLLRQQDHFLDANVETQRQMLDLQCQRRILAHKVGESRNLLQDQHNELQEETQEYNANCCLNKKKKRCLDEIMEKKGLLDRETSCLKEQIRHQIKSNQDLEKQIKCYSSQIQKNTFAVKSEKSKKSAC